AAQEKALGQNLGSAAEIWSKLSGGYLASYRSAASPGKSVAVTVSVDGTSGSSSFEYTAAHPPAVPTASSGPSGRSQALLPYPAFAPFVQPAVPDGPSAGPNAFWSSPASIAAVAALCALLSGAALWLLIGGVGRAEVGHRVSSFIPDAELAGDSDSLVAAGAPGVPLILARRRWWPGFALLVDV